jgi:hypothetical protein
MIGDRPWRLRFESKLAAYDLQAQNEISGAHE